MAKALVNGVFKSLAEVRSLPTDSDEVDARLLGTFPDGFRNEVSEVGAAMAESSSSAAPSRPCTRGLPRPRLAGAFETDDGADFIVPLVEALDDKISRVHHAADMKPGAK